MASLEEDLDKVPWYQLSHPEGVSSDVPFYLLELLSDAVEEQDEAIDHLWSSLCPVILETSCAAIPFLIQILQLTSARQKPFVAELLSHLASSKIYAKQDLTTLEMDGYDIPERRQHWKSPRQFLQEGNEAQPPHWLQQAHQLAGEGIPTYLSLLHSPDPLLVHNLLVLLGGFREWNTMLVPTLTAFLAETSDVPIKAWTLHCLSVLLDEHAPEWKYLQQILHADPASSDLELRRTAAQALALHHPGEDVATIVAVLGEAMLTPLPHTRNVSSENIERGHKRYWIDWQPLSALGTPDGFQELLRLLEQGASRWSILDTIRVAEATLDLAFFGGWVSNRDWNYSSSALISSSLHQKGKKDSSQAPNSTEMDEEYASFQLNYSSAPGRGVNGELVWVWGYDKPLARRLKTHHEHEGRQALSPSQQQAVQAVLRCDPLWKFPHNLMEIYGLPGTSGELKRFMAK
jgi:hypothetical protein